VPAPILTEAMAEWIRIQPSVEFMHQEKKRACEMVHARESVSASTILI
jgi:hypothetical protein